MSIIRAIPVETSRRIWGPFHIGWWKLYYDDGSDWTLVLWAGVRHVGTLSIHPPAWLLNALIQAGVLEPTPITCIEMGRLRKGEEVRREEET